MFSFNQDGTSIEFPDLPGCLTYGSTIEEATKNAKQCMGLPIYGMEQSNLEYQTLPKKMNHNKVLP
ncbi:MAG: type II toxin-antitoxin system HicB family antitoxin, partial [Bacilli bacterium]